MAIKPGPLGGSGNGGPNRAPGRRACRSGEVGRTCCHGG